MIHYLQKFSIKRLISCTQCTQTQHMYHQHVACNHATGHLPHFTHTYTVMRLSSKCIVRKPYQCALLHQQCDRPATNMPFNSYSLSTNLTSPPPIFSFALPLPVTRPLRHQPVAYEHAKPLCPRFPPIGCAHDAALPLPLSHCVRAYRLVRVLACHRSVVSYEARRADASDQESALVLKALALSTLKSWTELDDFNYEASLLQSVRNHPHFPSFVDRFDHDVQSDRVFVLVTSKPHGFPLSHLPTMLANGELAYTTLRPIFHALLSALDHCHRSAPAVVHANLKPRHIIIRLCADARPADCVDACTLMCPMPPSRPPSDCAFVTVATIQSGVQSSADDVYALAVSMLQVISAQSSDVWPVTEWTTPLVADIFPPHLRIRYPTLYRVLARMLHPLKLHRLTTAAQALRFIQLDPPLSDDHDLSVIYQPLCIPPLTQRPPPVLSSSSFRCDRDDDALALCIRYAPRRVTERTISASLFTLLWTAMSLSIVATPMTSLVARLVGASFACFGLTSGVNQLKELQMHLTLMFTVCPLNRHVACTVIKSSPTSTHIDQFDALCSAQLRARLHVQTNYEREVYVEYLVLADNHRDVHTIDVPMSRAEMDWLQDEINHFIESNLHLM